MNDRALHEDVRWLASTLGRVIRRLEGEASFEAVERLRRLCRARRRGDAGAPGLDALFAQVRAMPLDVAARVARAFTLFFVLINTAEQVQNARRLRALGPGAEQVRGSLLWALRGLHRRGSTADDVRELVRHARIRTVLTAHPTEATRRVVLELQARVADGLLEREGATEPERLRIESAIETDVELLWLTDEVRRDRPSVLEEISNAVWYLDERLLDAWTRLSADAESAFALVYGEPLDVTLELAPGSWVGGDRDGNPYVTPDVTLAAARHASYAVLEHYERRVAELARRLSLSVRLAPAPEALLRAVEAGRETPAAHPRNRDEPLRLALEHVLARLRATRDRVVAREGGEPGHLPGAYDSADGLAADLELVASALDVAHADHARRTLVLPLLALVRRVGFAGFAMDVRDDAAVHEAAVARMAESVGVGALDVAGLTRELLGRRPLVSEHVPLDEETERTLEVFRVMRTVQREAGERACSTCIASMCDAKEDLLRLLLLSREAGLVDLAGDPPRSSVDVVPLFETHDALERGPDVLRELFANAAYARQLEARGRRQRVMIGYSDSAKDVGMLASAWALYRAQQRVAAVCGEAGVACVFFHGQGGTVGRGGGSPVHRAIGALPPGTVRDGLELTEQGEVISQKFGIPAIAERNLEVLFASTLVAAVGDWRESAPPGAEGRFADAMTRLARKAMEVFRARVHQDDALFRLFLETTPVRELAHVHFGSRPAYRHKGAGTMKGIRAIPWNFGWTQTRLMLPAWLGAGTALEAMSRTELPLLREMARAWPFFDDLLSKIEMVCAKADLGIARLYVERLGGDVALFDELEAEFRRAVAGILAVRERDALLAGDAVLASAIELRNPYVDPLSLIQVATLERKRGLADDAPERALVESALGSTLNGVSQGMRNTG